MTDKTVINWNGGSTLQTWKDGEWQIVYGKDASGNAVTFSLRDDEAYRFSWAISPAAGMYFDKMRAAQDAVYELSYPEARAEQLRQIADEIDCGGGCEDCTPTSVERGDYCRFVAAADLRKLAAALETKASVDAERSGKVEAQAIMEKFDQVVAALKA